MPEKKPKKTFGIGLEATLAAIEKRHGKGAVMKFGEGAIEGVDVISTGVLSLDLGLGVGGLPRGRVVEYYGPEMSGKCCPADTRIMTPFGLLTVAELFERNGLKATTTIGTTEVDQSLYNRDGLLEETTHFTHNGVRPLLEVRTASGGEVRSTANHPHLVMSERGNWVWRKASELQPGDYLAMVRDVGRGSRWGEEVQVDEAYMAGLLLADGHLGETRISLTNNDPDIKGFIEKNGEALLGAAPRIYPKKDSPGSSDYHFNSKDQAAAWYQAWGWSPCTSPDKVVGKRGRSLQDPALIAMLQGYFDCECHVDGAKRTIEVISASHLLLSDIKLLLLRFGIVGLLKEKKVKAYPDNYYWRLTLGGEDARIFSEVIGTRSETRREQHKGLHDHQSVSTNHDAIPHVGGLLRDLYDSVETDRAINGLMGDYMGNEPRARLTYPKLDQIMEALQGVPGGGFLKQRLAEVGARRYYYDRVVEVVKLAPQPTFDFAMERSHSFIADGYVTHNTTLALQAIAQSQKRGGIAAFIDAEHALDPSLAEGTGVNVKELLISQPDSGEQALEIVDSLVRSAAIDIIVVDSVAALVPKAELEGNVGDTHVGRQARLMSQALRMLTGVIGKTGTVVIFINQIRQKIGVTFGSNKTTTGGNALKFYSSVRLDIRRIGSVKSGEEVVGNRVKVTVSKNKVAPPFQATEFDLIFGKGADAAMDVVELAVKAGIVTKSGSWYSYGEERLGQGARGVRAYFEENPDVYRTVIGLLKSPISDEDSSEDDSDSDE